MTSMYSRAWCLVLVAACGSSSTDGPAAGGPLLPESSGWIRIATVSPPAPLGTDHDAFAIAPRELVAQRHGGDAEVTCPASGGTVFSLHFGAAATV